MAQDRPRPSVDRVREQLRRGDPPEPADPESGDGPLTDRVIEARERVEPENSADD